MAKCGTRLHKCECGIERDACDGRHLCSDPICGGSWKEEQGWLTIILLIPFRQVWAKQVANSETVLSQRSPAAGRMMLTLLAVDADY